MLECLAAARPPAQRSTRDISVIIAALNEAAAMASDGSAGFNRTNAARN